MMMPLRGSSFPLLPLLLALAIVAAQAADWDSKWAKCWGNSASCSGPPQWETTVDNQYGKWEAYAYDTMFSGTWPKSCIFNGDWLLYEEERWGTPITKYGKPPEYVVKGDNYHGFGDGKECVRFPASARFPGQWSQRNYIQSYQAVGFHEFNSSSMVGFQDENFYGKTYNQREGGSTSGEYKSVMLWGCEPWTFRNSNGDCACLQPVQRSETGLCFTKLPTVAVMSEALDTLSQKPLSGPIKSVKLFNSRSDAGCKWNYYPKEQEAETMRNLKDWRHWRN